MNRKYIISERQEKMLIKEAIQFGFSLGTLDSIKDLQERINYCMRFLGEYIGKGGYRYVFELDDERVIKLAISENKIFQNKAEVQFYQKFKNKFPNLFSKVYKWADDFSWIISERVLPFKHEDCIAILGIPYSTVSDTQYARDFSRTKNGYEDKLYGYDKGHIGYSEYMNPEQHDTGSKYDEENDEYIEPEIDYSLEGFIEWAENISFNSFNPSTKKEDNVFYPLMDKYEFLQDIFDFIQHCDGANDLFDDNFGLAMRNGKPYIVILDSGFEELKTRFK